MKRISYEGVVDKTSWGQGPWMSEPDKLQWQDEATGLPCLIVRGSSGSWCGYVGVHPYHPAAGLSYNGEPDADFQARRAAFRQQTREWVAAGKPDLAVWAREHPVHPLEPEQRTAVGAAISAIEVHGGLTFASACAEITPERWESFRATEVRLLQEAAHFPRGDAARYLKQWQGCFADYDKFVERSQALDICHLPEPGEPDDLWWFGFDCAHFGDLMPGLRAVLAEMRSKVPLVPPGMDEVYRDMDYVMAECAGLAQQLKQIEAV